MSSTSTIEIFCCYAREDKGHLNKLKKHLMPLEWQDIITVWSDTDIDAGEEWEEAIKKHLNTSHIILLLISSDFLASSYCYGEEMKRAMERHENGEARVIPIILRSIPFLNNLPFGKLQMVPTNAKPVTQWIDTDDALTDISEHIGKIVKDLRAQQLFEEAEQLCWEKRFAEAIIIYDLLIRQEPGYAPAHFGKGQSLLELKKYEECLECLDRAFELDRKLANTHFYTCQARALEQLGRTTESLAAYDNAIQICDNNDKNEASLQKAFFYMCKAYLLRANGRYREALQMHEQSADLHPHGAIYAEIGDIQDILQHPEQALEAYQLAIHLSEKAESSNAREIGHFYHKLGKIFMQLEFLEKALEAYETAIEIDEQDTHFLEKGRCLLKLHRYSDARSNFEERISIWENDEQHIYQKDIDPYMYHGKGQALLPLQEFHLALESFNKAISLANSPIPDEFYADKALVYDCLATQTRELARSSKKNEPVLDRPLPQIHEQAEQNTSSGNPPQLTAFDVYSATKENQHIVSNAYKPPKGQPTPVAAYYQPILQALVDAGGAARVDKVLSRIEKLMESILEPVDRDKLASHLGARRWEITAQYAQNKMVEEGLLKEEPPYSFWKISETGREHLKQMQGATFLSSDSPTREPRAENRTPPGSFGKIFPGLIQWKRHREADR